MIPLHAMPIQILDVTAPLALVPSLLEFAAIVCGTALVALGYNALRADRAGRRTSGAGEPARPAPSSLGLRALEHPARAA